MSRTDELTFDPSALSAAQQKGDSCRLPQEVASPARACRLPAGRLRGVRVRRLRTRPVRTSGGGHITAVMVPEGASR